MIESHPFTTVALPDGIVVGGPWPHTFVSWPGGKSRSATKPEYDLFQALETSVAENVKLRNALQAIVVASGPERLPEPMPDTLQWKWIKYG